MTERGPKREQDEFALIARHFAPLAAEPAARALLDDVALVAETGALVVTTDAIVEGVHFLGEDPIAMVARKALRVNLSDLASKGATPLYYLLTLFWPNDRPVEDVAGFAAGLREDQSKYGVGLIGGDTVATPGPLSVSITMIGRAGVRTPARMGASVDDDLWVTGAIGDAGLGLAALRGEDFPPADRDYLVGRYRLPEPRIALAQLIASEAGASMDVSDGLLGDAAKLAAASGVGIDIEAAAIPLSPAAARWADAQRDPIAARARLAGRGDDYELLFAAPPARAEAIGAGAEVAGIAIARIGRARGGDGVRLMHAGAEVPVAVAGYVHRIGR